MNQLDLIADLCDAVVRGVAAGIILLIVASIWWVR